MNTSNKVHKYKKVLHSLNLRQSDLATKLNISRQRVNDILNGRSDFSEEQKIVLCLEYNINLNWLIADIGSMFIDTRTDAEILEQEGEGLLYATKEEFLELKKELGLL